MGPLPVQALECLPEVREMCAAHRCHAYGRRWTCPPGCGTLEDCARRLAGYRSGLLVQSTGRLEDDFDAETMLETERIHKERFAALAAEARRSAPDVLPLERGPARCVPSVPIRTGPAGSRTGAVVSMEAYGLLVSRVCARRPGWDIITVPGRSPIQAVFLEIT